jgi:hypothetical protein
MEPRIGSIVVQRSSFEPEKALFERKELTPWVSHIDPFPSEKPGIHGPRARSQ